MLNWLKTYWPYKQQINALLIQLYPYIKQLIKNLLRKIFEKKSAKNFAALFSMIIQAISSWPLIIVFIVSFCIYNTDKTLSYHAIFSGDHLYMPLGTKNRDKPVNPWAFIRIKNEIKTVKASLESMAPAFKRGVIGYLDSNDGTEEVIKEFVEKHPGFISFKYEHDVLEPHHPLYFKDSTPKERFLSSYYNAVLSRIPDGDWLVKIDADHIYDAEKLKKLYCMPHTNQTIVYISRINVFKTEDQIYLQRNFFKNIPDHWLLYKYPGMSFEMNINSKSGIAWEVLYLSVRNSYCTDNLMWHYSLQKDSRKKYRSEFINFTDFMSKQNLLDLHITEDMVDYDRMWYFARDVAPAKFSD